jgi:hypothetical protein
MGSCCLIGVSAPGWRSLRCDDRLLPRCRWTNQIEIYFSVVQRKVVSPNDFTNLDQVEHRLADFELRYNATARPFEWKFTRTDLDDLLNRIDRHQTTAPTTLTTAA